MFIRIKVYILYGSYTLKKFSTESFILSDNILINEKIIFDKKLFNISFTLWTRIGITIKAYHNKIDKKLFLVLVQNLCVMKMEKWKMENWIMKFGLMWNFFPRINYNTPFSFKFKKIKIWR